MFCPNCGRRVDESQPFCRFCGARLTSRAVIAEPPKPRAAVPELQRPVVSEPNRAQWLESIPTWLVDVFPRHQPRITCKICDRGVLVRKEIFRMSGPVVVIGYTLLIPSVIGIAISALVLFTSSKDSTTPDTGFVISAGFAIFWGIASFVGGLLGWLLVMKKRVLQCSVCGATVSA